MKGTAAIFGFPFRIYGEPSLPALEARDPIRKWRYRMHPPFRVREKGSPLSPDVPFHHWPEFKWSPKVSKDQRQKPPSGLSVAPFGPGPTAFDAMRVDMWGPGANTVVFEFARRFVSWVRFLTGQSWVGAYEAEADTSLKYFFDIDSQGRALKTPGHVGKGTPAFEFMQLLTRSLYDEAFKRSVGLEEVRTYWTVFHDALTSRAMGHMSSSILGLALSLEVARDTLFSAFAPTKIKPALGLALLPPFDGTDLLKHLGGILDSFRGRSLEKEEPDLWKQLNRLYVARHHVAHGKTAATLGSGGVVPVSDQHLTDWCRAVRKVLIWMESL